MKRKIIFATATGFFAVATVFNMNIFNENGFGNISLDAICALAQADPSEGTGDYAAERKYITGTGTTSCVKSDGSPGNRNYRYSGYDCYGTGNLACTRSLVHSYTSGCY